MNKLRSNREALGISQSRLARLSGVSRFNIGTAELGDRVLTAEEQQRLYEALRREASRLRTIADRIDQLRTAKPEEMLA